MIDPIEIYHIALEAGRQTRAQREAEPPSTAAATDQPEIIVDHGTLSAHVVNEEGMIVVRWLVKRTSSVRRCSRGCGSSVSASSSSPPTSPPP